jgi:hypothetical protein
MSHVMSLKPLTAKLTATGYTRSVNCFVEIKRETSVFRISMKNVEIQVS